MLFLRLRIVASDLFFYIYTCFITYSEDSLRTLIVFFCPPIFLVDCSVYYFSVNGTP